MVDNLEESEDILKHMSNPQACGSLDQHLREQVHAVRAGYFP